MARVQVNRSVMAVGGTLKSEVTMSLDPWQRWLGPSLSADDGADAEWMSQFTLTRSGTAAGADCPRCVRGHREALQRHDPRLAQRCLAAALLISGFGGWVR